MLMFTFQMIKGLNLSLKPRNASSLVTARNLKLMASRIEVPSHFRDVHFVDSKLDDSRILSEFMVEIPAAPESPIPDEDVSPSSPPSPPTRTLTLKPSSNSNLSLNSYCFPSLYTLASTTSEVVPSHHSWFPSLWCWTSWVYNWFFYQHEKNTQVTMTSSLMQLCLTM